MLVRERKAHPVLAETQSEAQERTRAEAEGQWFGRRRRCGGREAEDGCERWHGPVNIELTVYCVYDGADEKISTRVVLSR